MTPSQRFELSECSLVLWDFWSDCRRCCWRCRWERRRSLICLWPPSVTRTFATSTPECRATQLYFTAISPKRMSSSAVDGSGGSSEKSSGKSITIYVIELSLAPRLTLLHLAIFRAI